MLSGETGSEIAAVDGRRVMVRSYPFVGGETVIIPLGVYFEEHHGN